MPIHYLTTEQRKSIKPSTLVVSAYGGGAVEVLGSVNLDLVFDNNIAINGDFLVVKRDSIPLIGNNSLMPSAGVLKIDTESNTVTIQGHTIDIYYSENGSKTYIRSIDVKSESLCQRMLLNSTVQLPPQSETIVLVHTKFPPSTSNFMIEPQMGFRFLNGTRVNLPIGKALYDSSQFQSFPIRIMNPMDMEIQLDENSRFGTITPVTQEIIDQANINKIEVADEEERTELLIAEMDIGDLNNDQMERLRAIVKKNSKTILLSHELPSMAKVEPFKVYLKDDAPVASQSYPTAYSQRPALKEILDKQQSKGLIERGHSPWNSPTILVKKPNGSFRLVIDYRKVNQCIKGDSYPLPRIQDLLVQLKQSRIFSHLDLVSGYHQVPLEESSKEILCMGNNFGQFLWNVMPQGTKNAPSHFMRVMDTIFQDIPATRTLYYMDDLLVHSETIDENLERLDECFSLLAKFNLQCKAEKCKVLHPEVTFCGHLIKNGRILIAEDKVEAIKKLKTPKSKQEAQRLYGLFNYLRKHIQSFAKISKPITSVFSKGKFTWSVEAQVAVEKLKSAVITATEGLAIPDVNEDVFIVETDACDTAMAGCLFVCSKKAPLGAAPDWHDHDDHCLQPVEFFSKNFNQSQVEKLYIRDKELQAFRFSLNKWRMYLLGRKFIWRTDNLCLSYANETKKSNTKVARILAECGEFDYLIQNRVSTQMKVSDALTRSVDIHKLKISMNGFGELQKKDPVLSRIRTFVSVSRWPHHPVDERLRFWKKKSSDIELGDQGELIWNSDGIRRLIVPLGQRNELLKRYHDSSYHPGIKNTFSTLSNHFTWYKMKDDVEDFVRSCDECQRTKPNLHPSRPPLMKTDTPTQIFEKLSVDLIGPLPRTNRNHRWALVANDHFSKRMHTRPLKEKTASNTLAALKSIIFEASGRVPRNVLTDNGKEFMGCFASWLSDNGIYHSHSAPYSPSTNGLTERSNQSLKNRLKPHQNPSNWDELLLPVTMSINQSPNEVTKMSPFQVEFGIQGVNPAVHIDIVDQTLKNLDGCRSLIRDRIEKEKMSRVTKSSRCFVPFEIGVKVLIKGRPPSKEKFIGPFKVVEVYAGGRSYKVMNDNGLTYIRRSHELKSYVERVEVETVDECTTQEEHLEAPSDDSFDELILYPNCGLGWPSVSLSSFSESSCQNYVDPTINSEIIPVGDVAVVEDATPQVVDQTMVTMLGNSISDTTSSTVVDEIMVTITGDSSIDATDFELDDTTIEAGAAALARATVEAAMNDPEDSFISDGTSVDTVVDVEASVVAEENQSEDASMRVEPLSDGDATMVEVLPGEAADVSMVESETPVQSGLPRKRVRSESSPVKSPLPKRSVVAPDYREDCGNSFLEYTNYELSSKSIRDFLRTRDDFDEEHKLPISDIHGGKSFCLEDQSYLQLSTLALRWKCPLKHYDLNNIKSLRRRLSSYCRNSDRIVSSEVQGKWYFMYR